MIHSGTPAVTKNGLLARKLNILRVEEIEMREMSMIIGRPAAVFVIKIKIHREKCFY